MSATDPRERGPKLARDVVLIVIVGTVLGLAYNQSMLLANDTRALSWVEKERTTGVLELPAAITPAPVATPTAAPVTTPAPAELATAAHDTLNSVVHVPKKQAAEPAANVKKPVTKKPATATPAPKPAAAKPAAATPAAAPAPATAAAPVIPDTREPLEARFAVVKALHDADAAVFVDARTAEEYAAGHIAGAISLPFDDVFKKPELAKQLEDHGKPIVTYCDGGDCELSKDLAFSLIDQGHKKVLFFKDGLPGWKSGGGATHTGAQP